MATRKTPVKKAPPPPVKESKFKKIKHFFIQFDGFWSVPLAFGLFWVVGIALQSIFGYQTGTYDVAFIQPLFLAGAVVIGATNIAVFGLYFTFRELYRFFYGYCKDKKLYNESKNIWTNLLPWQKYLLSFSVFFYFVTVTIIVYLHLV